MNLTLATLIIEAFLLVFARIGSFVAVAPLLGHRAVYARLRVFMALCITLAVFPVAEIGLPKYDSVFGYGMIVVGEALVGLSLGLVAKLVMEVINLAGEFIDREIGFTMATNFDPSTGGNVTISAELYDRLIYLVIVVTNLHHYILRALARSFELVPVGQAKPNILAIHGNVIALIGEYFSIGFRIAMPIFIGATLLNVILGILTKSSPQMNMFAIGMQLKVIIGLLVMSIAIMFIPNIATFLMEKVQSTLEVFMGGL